MPITIGSNIASLQATRRLDQTSSELSKVFERLSSGQRINRASDDAAGLSISDSLKANRRVFSQGVRNLNDGISLTNIADGTIEQLSSIVTRIRELATQAANGSFSPTQRKALDGEAQALRKEYSRISQSTKFNGLNLFNGSFSEIRLQGGYGVDGSIASGLGGALGTGSFGSSVSYAQESRESDSVALADLNGDGILDLVTTGVTDALTASTTVRLGQGDGTFGSSTSYSLYGAAYQSVQLKDLNNDGKMDLLAVGGNNIVTRLGLGDGTFGAIATASAGFDNALSSSTGDLNGDGILDLVISGPSAGMAYFQSFLGNGDGTFRIRQGALQSGTSSPSVALGDLNGDGILDLVTSTFSAGAASIDVRFGNGDGSFRSTTNYAMSVSNTATAVALGDLNGDGRLDIVLSGESGLYDESIVRLNSGNGTFGAANTFVSGFVSVTTASSLADLNGDGFLDLVNASNGGAGMVVRLGTGTGSFSSATSYTTETGGSEALAVGDLNGDGVLDIVTAGDTAAPDGYATVRLGNTTPGVSPLLPFSLLTIADARQAMGPLDQKLAQLSAQRGTIGALQSRLSTAINTLQSTTENYASAESRIRDTDVASDTAGLVRTQILQQAASAILSQANQQPSLALKLLS